MVTTTIKIADSRFGILRTFAVKTGKSTSELASEAVNKYIDNLEESEATQRRSHEALMSAAGGWKDREDFSIFEEIRKESSRFPEWTDRTDGE